MKHAHVLRPLLVPAGSGSLQLANGRWLIRGWAFRERSGVLGATIDITDATKVGGGGPIIPITLAASESTRDFPPGDGIIVRAGVFLEITGNVVGSVLVMPYEATLNDVD